MHPRSRENRLRRAARGLGLRLEKSRARDPHDSTFRGYMLVYIERNAIAYGAAGHEGRGYSLTLDDVEAYLKRREKRDEKLGLAALHRLFSNPPHRKGAIRRT
jgi:hypothetical protein